MNPLKTPYIQQTVHGARGLGGDVFQRALQLCLVNADLLRGPAPLSVSQLLQHKALEGEGVFLWWQVVLHSGSSAWRSQLDVNDP